MSDVHVPTIARNRMQGHYWSLSSRKHGTLDQLGMSRRKPLKTLTAKQQAFLCEFPKDLNATRAAIRAGYSRKTAEQQGCRLAKKLQTHVQSLVKVPQDEGLASEAKSGLTRFMQALEWLAFYDPRKLFDTYGKPIAIPELPDDVAFAIASFEVCEEFTGRAESRKTVGYTKKYKFIDKLAALTLYGKVMGFDESGELGHGGGSDQGSSVMKIVFVSPDGKKSMAAQPPRVVNPIPQVEFVSRREEC